VQSLDPHSSLLPKEAFEDLQIDTKGNFTGIGIHITLQDGFVTVISPIEDTPAYRAGIEAGDRIIKVDGQKVKDLREAVNMMRGPKGTKVAVTILREGVKEPMNFDLVRDVIPVQSVKYLLFKPGYGYVRVSNFTGSTTKDLEAALSSLEGGEVPLKGLVLDLRNNGGGLLNQAITVTDLFLDQGEILSIKGRYQKNTKHYNATVSDPPHKYRLIVLINGGSASASEIVAGALQDRGRAVVMGSNSFGKGSVQTILPLSDERAVKLTTALYFTPNGRSIQAEGIVPDIPVERARVTAYDSAGQVTEADLSGHLSNGNGDKARGASSKLASELLASDNQLYEALTLLKGINILGMRTQTTATP